MPKPHFQKPVIYLPTRALIVPCDYDPEPKKVEFRNITVGFKFEVIGNQIYKVDHWVERGIER